MADKMTDLFDAEIRAILQASATNRQDQLLQDQIAAKKAADPTYGEDFIPSNTAEDQVFYETRARLADRQSLSEGRNVGEHLQDMGAGLLGTLGTIGNTAFLGVSVAGDALGNLTGTHPGWAATKESLQEMRDASEFTRSLQSEKSDAFDRITQYRQNKAIEQANIASRMLTGEDASWIEQQGAAFGEAATGYLDNPAHIVTEGVAQLPYLMTGGIAKGVTQGTSLANPLIAQLSKKMSVESAEKLVQMGLVGGMQGTIEGADAASTAYTRVMESQDTFGPGDEAARESAALDAAAKAFGIAGATSAITGTLASKWDLNPFGATGAGVLGRSGDNLIKALQEGVQEAIESGTSQFAGNYAGNTVLEGKDRVDLAEGVGGAAGTGFMVGTGSTVVTNPRSAVDAALVPLALAGKSFGYVGRNAVATERREDMAAAVATADSIVENVTTPAAAAAMNQGVEQTTDTPAEQVELPPEIDTRTQVGLFATGMEYLRGKDMNSGDAVSAFHVLGSVLAAANNIRALRDGAAQDAADESLSPEDRERATTALQQLDTIMDNDQLDKWVEQLPMEDIEAELEDLRQNPESFGSVIAHLSAMNPLKMTDKLVDAALESKTLPKAQRDSLLLAQELKAAEAELEVGAGPNSSEVSRSIMQTGFPGASSSKQSIAEMLRTVTGALEQNDPESAQIFFNKLVKFSNFMAGKAQAFEAAKTALANDPENKPVDIQGYGTWVTGKDGVAKFDKNTPFRLNSAVNSLAVVGAVRKDADVVAKMVSAMQKRTGLKVLEAPVTPPVAEVAPAAPKAQTESKKAEIGLSAAPASKQEESELESLSDEAINQEIDTLTDSIRRRRSDTTGKAVEQDTRYNNLVREVARRMTAPKLVVDKPVEKVAPAKAEPVAAPVDIAFEEPTINLQEIDSKLIVESPAEASRNHFSDLQPSYPVAEGASGVERNDATNHLSQSFTSSDQPGLRSKGEALSNLDTLKQVVNVAEEDVTAVEALFSVKNKLLNRLQQLVGVGGVAKAKHMLGGGNLWKSPKFHFLYATKWDAKTGISYQEEIAQVMAWTGVQHMMDMINPVSWSNDLIQQMQDTYGAGIREKLMDGWVPMKDQTEQLARKLQANLELKADKKVSVEYTEGTMLALAGRILEAMISNVNYSGVLQHETIKTQEAGLPVQWIRMSVEKTDMMFDAARILEDFLPERASTNQAHVGTPPKSVNSFYRGSQQKIGKEQKEALKRRGNVAHKLSPLMHNLWSAIPASNEQFFRLFGMDLAVKNFPTSKRDLSISQIARKGANNTTYADLKVIHQHIRKLKDHAATQEEADLYSIPSYFEYEQVTNGRAMTKGTSPQSSKWYRELFAIAQYQVDPTKDNRGFLMSVAQGLGVKMDIQRIDESLAKLQTLLAQPDMVRALEAATRLGDKHDYANDATLLDADLAAIEALDMEKSPHMMSALVHYAQYQKGKPFTSSLMYEIDGKTDGPINLMMLLGLSGSAADMEAMLGLGGLFFGDDAIAVQDMTEQLKSWNGGKKDLYEIITGKATELTPQTFDYVLKTVVDKAKPEHKDLTKKRATSLMKATLHLVKMAGLGKGDVMKLAMEYERAFSKKSTQAAGYLQGGMSISGDLLNTLMETISARIDAGELSPLDQQAIDTFFSYSLGSSKLDGPYFNGKPEAYEGLEWNGQALTHKQWQTARATINTFIGGALFNGLVETIGPQRENMMAAVTAMQARIEYADHVLRTRYKAKQAELVEAGELHPGQALSKVDEQAIVKDVWEKLVPHPMLRNTAGLPVGSVGRHNGSAFAGSVKLDNTRRIENRYFDSFSHYSGLSEAMLEDPGVSFAALSIMAAGDGSMMTGLLSKTEQNVLDMYDGLYMSPEIIDEMGTALNQEVKANWDHDFIGAVLTSLQQTEDDGFREWAASVEKGTEQTLLDVVRNAETKLKDQRERQINTMRDINSRPHSVSHMAGHGAPAFFPATPLNSTTLGTSVTDPLLDLAADELGTVANGIRKMSATDVKALLQGHTFENPVLSGLWKVLSPLVNDNLTLFMSSDKQALADFYQQNERREMASAADGVSIGDRVYLRAINAETLVHELLHHTTKSLTATYFWQPSALTGQQRSAMKNLVTLQDQFMAMDATTLEPHQQAMVEHVQTVMRGLDQNSAMQEFLAYGLSNYHLQRTLGNTKSWLGQLAESVFNTVKALFGFPSGTQSDSMLAQMFSNFESLTEQAANVVYPVSVETALNAINPELARSFGDVLTRLEQRSATIAKSIGARADARTRMQELADTNLFPSMTNEQQSAAEYIQAMFSTGLQFKSDVNALLARVVDAVREEGPKAWRDNTDPNDQADIDLAQARYEYFFENPASRHDRTADILSMALVNPEFAAYMEKVILPRQEIDKGSLNNWLDSSAKALYDKMDTGLSLNKDATLSAALEVAALRLRKSLLASVKRQETKPGAYRKLTDKMSEGVQWIGEKAGKTADARLRLTSNKDWIGSGLTIVAGMTNTRYADMLGNMVLSLTNQMEGAIPAREVVQEMVGTVGDNFKLIQLKGIAARMVSAIRQTFREQVPVSVKSWFKDLTPEQDSLLHLVIGKMAVYSLSPDLKDRMEELLTDPTNAKLDAEMVLMSGGNRTQRLLMIKYAKHLGDRMANKGNQALYLNTQAVAGLAVHGGAGVLTAPELEALENLSTLQALSHLTPIQRRSMLSLYRENTEGFWKTTALIHSFHNFDTQRAGNQTATMNFQKGWIPVEADGRKKVKLFQRSEIAKAQRMGWVQVGEFADDANLVYMATTIGKTPTLSGGAIHSVDFHMNGIHFHSGMPTDPSIQTTITHPRTMSEIRSRILNGEVMPYVALYDAAGDVQGFQRSLDPAVVERHTKTVGRISDAAGIWLGRLHEERVAHGQNQAAAELLRKTWDKGQTDRREKEFVNIRQPVDPRDPNAKQDKILANVWETLPYHTKVQLEAAFNDGSKNPPIWIRRDQLNDAIGYHKASVSNFFTGDSRYDKATNANVAALSRQVLGKNAYKYLLMAEEGWQALIGSAKDTIIVKSLVVALNNLASNQTQLFMITGNPVWNLRVQSQKHKELVSYLGYQQRIARLTAEELATNDPKAKARINTEQAFLKNEMRKLSIYPLIEAGEMPTIAEGLSETEEFSLVGDFTEWAEKQMGKLPGPVSTVLNNLAVSKETSLYKGLDRMVQYGDFVAKATMYEWLTTQDAAAKKEAFDLYTNDTSRQLTMAKALHEVALKEINDEFVNYARLPGRWRTYGEDMGLLWFYNYKLRIMKMAFRRARKNPAAFLIGSQVGGMLGIATLTDSLPWNINFSYSTGIDPLFTAHQTIVWNQML